MRRLIRDYAERGNAVLVSSHLLSELAMTADSLVVIGRGRLIGQLTTEEFVRTTAPTSVRVRVDRPEQLRDEAVEPLITLIPKVGEDLIDWMPFTNAMAFTSPAMAAPGGSGIGHGPWTALAVFAAWAVGLAVIAALVEARRDA